MVERLVEPFDPIEVMHALRTVVLGERQEEARLAVDVAIEAMRNIPRYRAALEKISSMRHLSGMRCQCPSCRVVEIAEQALGGVVQQRTRRDPL